MNGDVVTLAWNGKVESFTIGEMWAGMCVENMWMCSETPRDVLV